MRAAAPSSSSSPFHIYLPRNLSYCNVSGTKTYLRPTTCKSNSADGDGPIYYEDKTHLEIDVTAAKLRRRTVDPYFQKIMSEIMGEEENKLVVQEGEDEEGETDGDGRRKQTSQEGVVVDDSDEYPTEPTSSFDEGIYINLMDHLSLDTEQTTTTTTAVSTISINEDKDSAASSSTETSEPESPLPGIIIGGSLFLPMTTNNNDPQKENINPKPSSSPPSSVSVTPSLPGGHRLDEIVSGVTPMAGICTEPPLSQGSSSSGRSIVSSVQSFFSANPQNSDSTATKLLDLLSPASPIYDDDEFNFPRGELRKSTSLKSNKTPPGTPRRKKVVRFADVMGLDLESVIHVLNMDSPPKIPPSALADLHSGIEVDRKSVGTRLLTACFSQPSASEGFMARVCTEKVCLENAVISDLTITGIIRVANIGFHKIVHIRYTTTGWSTHHDVAASYVHSSCDGPTDRFSFSIVAPSDFSVGSRLEFAISYTCGDIVYWDNNHDLNYTFECYAKTGLTEAEDTWMHFL